MTRRGRPSTNRHYLPFVRAQAERLLAREDDQRFVRRRLVEALSGTGLVRAELTFNVTNVLLDFESDTATVTDELDPAEVVTVSLDDLRRYCR